MGAEHLITQADGTERIRLQNWEVFGEQVNFRCYLLHVSEYSAAAAPLICPASFSIIAAAGATSTNVAYAVTATDNCTVASTPCTPASGSAFALGVTTVNCVATEFLLSAETIPSASADAPHAVLVGSSR